MLNVGFLSNLTFQSHADQVAGAEGGLKTRMEVSPQEKIDRAMRGQRKKSEQGH